MKIQTLDQRRSASLIDFLLGDDNHPGWLDQQSYQPLSCPGYSDDPSGMLTARGVWHSSTEQSEFGIAFKRLRIQEATATPRATHRSILKF
jgi:hypothetical protein